MNFNLTSEQIVIVIVSLIAGVALAILWLRRDDRGEARRKKCIALSQICKKKGFTYTADLLTCYAVYDWDGMFGVVEAAFNALTNEDTANAHFAEIFKLGLNNPANVDLILKRAEEIQALEAIKNVKTAQSQQIGDITIEKK